MTKRRLPALVRSTNHVCFRLKADGADWSPMVDGEAARVTDCRDVDEFFVDDSGAVMFRASGRDEPRLDWGDAVVVYTGAWHVAQACKKWRCAVPEATARRLASIETAAAKGPTEPGNRSRNVKGKTSGVSIIEMWARLFAENEGRVKAGKKPWTDAELIEKMKAEFPASAGKSTLSRPRMFRACFNAGTHFYKKHGKPSFTSFMYDENGDPVARGKRFSDAAKAAAASDQTDADAAEQKDKISLAEHAKRRQTAGAKKSGALKQAKPKSTKKKVTVRRKK